MGLKGYASLNHFNGPEGWIKHIAASAGDKRQKKKNVGILCTFWWVI
jgi:hypothetical protein